MNVRELIEKLEHFPMGADVRFRIEQFGDVTDYDVDNVHFSESGGAVILEFEP